MIDKIFEEMLACRIGHYLQAKRLDVLIANRKKLVEDGDTDALSGADASIKEAETRKSYSLRRHRELRNRMRANAQRSASYEKELDKSKLLNPIEFYLAAIEWLQNNRPADAKDEQETYWDRFIRSRPDDEFWVL